MIALWLASNVLSTEYHAVVITGIHVVQKCGPAMELYPVQTASLTGHCSADQTSTIVQ